ncbi:MAG: glycosyltransferase family 4 protein [Saccharofermentans sp.]|nr:glycosyltransferase family 4 protein [Saccharofermentans sp.]
MTVLQVCAYAAPYEGNFIKSLRALGKALAGKNVHMYYVFPENARRIDWVQDLAKETKVYFLPLSQARVRLQTYKALKAIFAENLDIEIVHSHFELYDVPVVMTAPKNVKVFWHLHDALENYSSFRHRIIHRIQYGFLYGDATLLSVSHKHMKYVLECGFPSKKAIYIPNGIDTERIKLIETDPIKRIYDFLIFGWEFDRKGVDLCITAIKNSNLNCKVAVVGSENTAEIIQKRFGEVSQVDVVAPVRDINQLYSNTRCFLHISRAEGLSYALLEAAYSGLPVICSNISENRFAEIFRTITMVENEDTTSIGKAMEMQLANSSISDYDVQEVRRIIDDNYSISCWVKNIVEQYGK